MPIGATVWSASLSAYAYVLVAAVVGRVRDVGQALQELTWPSARLTSCDTVTGPYDIIVRLESDDLDSMRQCIDAVQAVEGVRRTSTCLAVALR